MNLRRCLQFNRILSSRLTRVFVWLGVSPNLLTGLGLACGIFSMSFMALGDHASLLWGALWLHLSFIMDNCDGELARATGRKTRFGVRFDLVTDLMVDLLLWSGLALGSYVSWDLPHEAAILFGVTACAGSILNFSLVVWERKTGRSTSIHVKQIHPRQKDDLFHVLLDTLAHNGDSITLGWVAAVIGRPGIFLGAGALFINILWVSRAYTNRHALVSALARVVDTGAGKALRHLLKAAMFALGIYLVYLSFREVSWKDLGQLWTRGGFGLLFILLVYPVSTLFHTLGLFSLFPAKTRAAMDLKEFYWINLTGDSINKITPFMDVGGEPVKIAMIHRRRMAPLDEAVTAVCMCRVLFIATEIAFVLAGVLALAFLAPSRDFLWIGLGGAFISLILILLLKGAHSQGLLRSLPRALERLSGAGSEGALRTVWERSDQDLRDFFRTRRRDFWTSFFWNEMGWVFFLLEVYLAFWIWGVPMTLAQAFIIQSLLQAIKTVSFFIPGNLGAQEGGLAYLLHHLHFTSAHGIALSLLKRFRQFVWAALCPALVALLPKRRELQPTRE